MNPKHIRVDETNIRIIQINGEDYICLTDMVKNFDGGNSTIGNWISNKETIEFLGLWEKINSPNFKLLEFQEFYNAAGVRRFVLSPQKWIETTNAIGIVSKSGRQGGTYAHKDIAFEFGSWLNPEFKLYLIKEFQRLKEQEALQSSTEWNLRRVISKTNYGIHTDAIKEYLIPPNMHGRYTGFAYADEADVLNIAMKGMTAKQWREENPEKAQDGSNMRDYMSISELIVFSNLESLNAELIARNLSKPERLKALNETAIRQMKSFAKNSTINKINGKESGNINKALKQGKETDVNT